MTAPEAQPRTVRLPLKQHIGVPAEPVVQTGARVAAGDLIAQVPAGKLGASLHASICGQVRCEADSIWIEAD